MEVGLDRWHTDFEVMKKGMEQGFCPNIISTDVTRFNMEPLVRDLLFTASKVMAAGLLLPEALAAVTINPATAMKCPELAELKEGGAGQHNRPGASEGRGPPSSISSARL